MVILISQEVSVMWKQDKDQNNHIVEHSRMVKESYSFV